MLLYYRLARAYNNHLSASLSPEDVIEIVSSAKERIHKQAHHQGYCMTCDQATSDCGCAVPKSLPAGPTVCELEAEIARTGVRVALAPISRQKGIR